MNALTLEWLDKAEGDYFTALRESRVRRRANYDAVCFHAQQCAEKLLKAFLQESGIEFPYRHDLEPLLNLCCRVDPLFEPLRANLITLDKYAVDYRYPGEQASRSDAMTAMKEIKRVRAFMLDKLDMPATKSRKKKA